MSRVVNAINVEYSAFSAPTFNFAASHCYPFSMPNQWTAGLAVDSNAWSRDSTTLHKTSKYKVSQPVTQVGLWWEWHESFLIWNWKMYANAMNQLMQCNESCMLMQF